MSEDGHDSTNAPPADQGPCKHGPKRLRPCADCAPRGERWPHDVIAGVIGIIVGLLVLLVWAWWWD